MFDLILRSSARRKHAVVDDPRTIAPQPRMRWYAPDS